MVIFEKSQVDEAVLFDAATEAGAEDFIDEGDTVEVLTGSKEFEKVRAELESKSLKYTSAEITKLPATTVKIDNEKTATKLLNLVEILQDHDDVQNVYANFDMDEELLNKIISS